MINVFLKAGISIFLLLASQTVISDNRHGDGRSRSDRPHKNTHRQIRSSPQAFHNKRLEKKERADFSRRDRDYYRPGYHTRYLPYGSSRVHVGNQGFYFFDGFFYQPFQNQYRIVDAPIGAIVLSLPRLHFNLQWNGVNFYVAGNTYYRRHPRGYIVVRNPGFRDNWR